VATLSSAFTAAVNKSGPPELITAGPYQRIRHPSYLAMLIVVAASTILLNSVWCAVAGVALVVPAYLYRIHCEEMILRKQFGAKFDKYTGDRWKIMPFVH
jgi:protein-S-isoprenylcysteine O-methyltransferase Ste14